MINIGNILKRAWHILWNYKMLWIFGLLLAFTAGGGGGNNGSGYQFNGNTGYDGNNGNNPNFQPGPRWDEFNTWYQQDIAPLVQHPEKYIATFIWIGVALVLFLILMGVIFTFVRYTSESAILRMVDEYEQTGTKVGFRQGWKLGWSRRAFRMWVIDLLISLPAMLFLGLMLGLGILVGLSVVNGSEFAAAAGMISAIGCFFLFIFVFIVLMVFLGLLRQFFVRAAALEETGIGDSFRRGWAMFKGNWKSAALMWLVMLGIGFGYGLASMILFFLLIPVYLILLLPAVLVAAIPGAIAYGIASLFAGNILAAIIGVLFALPLFFTVLFSPLIFVGGLYMVYESTIWTLTYREMKALAGLQPGPEVDVQAEAG